MAITLASNAQNAACNAITALVDVSGPGNIQIGTTAFASILADFTLSNPAFGTASAGAASLLGVPKQDTSANNTGTAATWRMRTSGGTAILTGNTATTADNSDITLDVSAQNAALNAISTLINSGSTDATGDLQMTTTADTTFATPLVAFNLAASSFGAASAGSMTITGSPSGAATVAGTATLFRLRTRDNVEVLRGSVGTSAADLIISNNVFGVGSTITITGMTISLAATSGPSIGVLVFAGGLAFTAGETIEVTTLTLQIPAT